VLTTVTISPPVGKLANAAISLLGSLPDRPHRSG
jgi:hypothetical protein